MDMFFQANEKRRELLGSWLLQSIPSPIIAKLEERGFYGDKTRVDGRIAEAKLRVSIYRPEEFKEGTPVLIRLLRKPLLNSGHVHKLVVIPNPLKDDGEQVSYRACVENMTDLLGVSDCANVQDWLSDEIASDFQRSDLPPEMADEMADED